MPVLVTATVLHSARRCTELSPAGDGIESHAELHARRECEGGDAAVRYFDHMLQRAHFSSGGRVNIEGRGNVVTNFVSLGGGLISATDLTFNGGIIGGEEGKPLEVAMSIERNGDDRRVAHVDRVRIRNVAFRDCKTAVRVSGVVKDVKLLDNRFDRSGLSVVIAEEGRSEVFLSGHQSYATEGASRSRRL